METLLKAKRFIISGLVQGVGYRFFAVRCARKYQLKGYVRNIAHGDVEVYAEGKEEELKSLYEDLLKGPSMARVTEIKIHECPYSGHYEDFEIKY